MAENAQFQRNFRRSCSAAATPIPIEENRPVRPGSPQKEERTTAKAQDAKIRKRTESMTACFRLLLALPSCLRALVVKNALLSQHLRNARPIPPSIAPSPDPHHANAYGKRPENRPNPTLRVSRDAPATRPSPLAARLPCPHLAHSRTNLSSAQPPAEKPSKRHPFPHLISPFRALSSPRPSENSKKPRPFPKTSHRHKCFRLNA